MEIDFLNFARVGALELLSVAKRAAVSLYSSARARTERRDGATHLLRSRCPCLAKAGIGSSLPSDFLCCITGCASKARALAALQALVSTARWHG